MNSIKKMVLLGFVLADFGSYAFAGQDVYIKGGIPAGQVQTLYSSTHVTSAAWVQIVASLPAAVSGLEIFDSSGSTMILGVGPAGFEVEQMIIFPGGNPQKALPIPAGSRISLKAVSTSATSGENDINFSN